MPQPRQSERADALRANGRNYSRAALDNAATREDLIAMTRGLVEGALNRVRGQCGLEVALAIGQEIVDIYDRAALTSAGAPVRPTRQQGPNE